MATIARPIYVKWVDSEQTHGWTLLRELESSLVMAESIGWLLGEDDEKVIVAAHYVSPKSEREKGQASGIMAIPKRSIIKRKNLRIPR